MWSADREEAQKYIGYLADFFSLYDELTVYQYLEYFAGAYKLAGHSIPGRILEVVTARRPGKQAGLRDWRACREA